MDASHIVTLRDYVERIFAERQAALDLAFRSQQEALQLATRALELRLEKLNELRQEVTTDRGNYVTRDKYDADMNAIKSQLDRFDGGMTVVQLLAGSGALALVLEIGKATGLIK